MIRWEDFRAEVRRRKALVWVALLQNEGPHRAAGRRPRDPEKEALLAKIDRMRVAKSKLLADSRSVPVEDPESE